MLNEVWNYATANGWDKDDAEVYSEAAPSTQLLEGQNVSVERLTHFQGHLKLPLAASPTAILCLSSSARVTARLGGQEIEGHVRAGEAVILPVGSACDWRWPEGESGVTLHLSVRAEFLSAISGGSKAGHGRVELMLQVGVQDAQLHHIGLLLLHEMESWGTEGDYIELLTTALAVHLLRSYAVRREDTSGWRGGLPGYKLRRILEFINDHLAEDIRLADMAEEVNLSRFHFTRVFKQTMGVAPRRYVMEQRIERAKQLLAETEMPIVEIALEVGFQSHSRFTTLFREVMGTTPRAYRRDNEPPCELGVADVREVLPPQQESGNGWRGRIGAGNHQEFIGRGGAMNKGHAGTGPVTAVAA